MISGRRLCLWEKEKKKRREREKKRQSVERETNLLVVQFFFETKLLLFLNCVCGSCCAIDIVSSYSINRGESVLCCYCCGFGRFSRRRPSQKNKIRIETLKQSLKWAPFLRKSRKEKANRPVAAEGCVQILHTRACSLSLHEDGVI